MAATETRKPITYKISEALALLAKHGFDHPSIGRDAVEADRLVWIKQDWTPKKGKEIAKLVLARGKYRGQSVGVVYRGEPKLSYS